MDVPLEPLRSCSRLVVALGVVAMAACAHTHDVATTDDDASTASDASVLIRPDATALEVDAAPSVDAASVDGSVADGGAFESSAVRLVSPLSGATLFTTTPTLTWLRVAGADSVRVEVCGDRACARVEQTFDSSATSAPTPTALSAGQHYWHALGLLAGAPLGAVSPTWQFSVRSVARVGPAPGPGSRTDFDGDGYGDVVAGAIDRLLIYRGSASGVAATPSQVLTTTSYPRVLAAGDFDGDGFTDLAYGDAGAAPPEVFVWMGGPSGLSAAVTLEAPADTPTCIAGFGIALTSGDIDGDGLDELIVSADHNACGIARVYVYAGSALGIGATPSQTISPPPDASPPYYFGMALASADLDGDGLADVATTHITASGTTRVDIYRGGAGVATTSPLTLDGPAVMGEVFGDVLADAGDLNGDGFTDLAIGTHETESLTGHVYLFLGGASGVASTPDVTLTMSDSGRLAFGETLAGAGDLDADGYADLVVGAGAARAGVGRAYVYAGGPIASLISGVPAVLDDPLVATDPTARGFGIAIVGDRDLNGDGFSDVALGAMDLGGLGGQLCIYGGGAAGIGMSPTVTIDEPALQAFGALLALLGASADRRAAGS